MNATRRTFLRLPPALVGLGAPALARSPGGAMGRILAAGKLRAGVWLESGPYGHLAPDGLPAGLEVEVARDIARQLGVTVELLPLGFSERFAAVALRHVDIASALMVVTAERLRHVAFAAPHGLFETVLVSLVARPITTPAGLAGRRIAMLSQAMLGGRDQIPSDTQVLFVADNQEALTLLRQGEIAGIVMAASAFRRLSLADSSGSLIASMQVSQVPYAVAVSHGEPDLLHFLNTWVFLRKEDGTLAAWHQRFLESPRLEIPRL